MLVVSTIALCGCELVSGIDDRGRAAGPGAGGGGGGGGGDGGSACPPCGTFECVDGVCDVPLPTDGLVLRLRADVGVVVDENGRVREWHGVGSGLVATQSVASNRPELTNWGQLDEHRGVAFDALAESYLVLPPAFDSFPDGLSAFVVALATGSDHGRFLDLGNAMGDSSIVFGRWSTTDELRYETHDTSILAAYRGQAAFGLDDVQLFEVVHSTDTGEAVLLRNGHPLDLVEAVPGGIPSTPRLQCRIGRSNFTSPGYLTGMLVEVVLYARALSVQERGALESNLMAFYGIVP
jgi:hypothetical protein